MQHLLKLWRQLSLLRCFFYPVWRQGMARSGPCIWISPIKHRGRRECGVLRQVGMMLRALWTSPVRNMLFVLGGAIFTVIAATAYGQIRLNRWNQPFYDALAHRDFHGFVTQLGVFVMITGALLVLNVGQRWLSEMLKLKLREGLVQDLVGEWLKPHRAFRLAKIGPVGVNPDQRMHEDARHLTELSSDLGWSCCNPRFC